MGIHDFEFFVRKVNFSKNNLNASLTVDGKRIFSYEKYEKLVPSIPEILRPGQFDTEFWVKRFVQEKLPGRK